jgi:hypothetical protein
LLSDKILKVLGPDYFRNRVLRHMQGPANFSLRMPFDNHGLRLDEFSW